MVVGTFKVECVFFYVYSYVVLCLRLQYTFSEIPSMIYYLVKKIQTYSLVFVRTLFTILFQNRYFIFYVFSLLTFRILTFTFSFKI